MDKDLLENSEFKEEMLKYTFALNRLTSELEILLEEYKFKNEYNPVEHIKTRIKSFSSIKGKLERKGLDVTVENMIHNIGFLVLMGLVIIADLYHLLFL